MHTSIHSTVENHFRTPEGFFDFALLGEPQPRAEFFHFGKDVTGYGRLCNGNSVAAHDATFPDALGGVQFEGSRCLLPFDPAEVASNLRMERYSGEHGLRDPAKDLVRAVYYALRPLLPVPVRKYAQRRALRGWDRSGFPGWPIDCSVDRLFEKLLALALKARQLASIPFIWFWPEESPGCIVMTHDVETVAGLKDCDALMDLDESYGILSSFQLIPGGRYHVSASAVAAMRARGFEVNIHDWNHDGLLFRDYERFLDRAAKINRAAALWQVEGFRSAVLYRNPDWYDALQFAYDMSIPSTARLDPQHGGCCTVLPWFIGSILEIPVTTTQDYSLFNILNQHTIELWQQQIAAILENHGMASFIVHPDYIRSPRPRRTYMQLLEHFSRLHAESGVWIALPHQVDRWWRERNQMRMVRNGDAWEIQGPGSERARVAYAYLDGDRIVYSFTQPATPTQFAHSGAPFSCGGESLV
jgi:hypothetical protein